MTCPADSSFDDLGRYIIADYHEKPPFSSFLPGIAGKWGVPMWAFYVNRGQAVASFGIESKDNPILEFQPANKAYQVTPFLGFRTFLKMEREGERGYLEPFATWSPGPCKREMHIGMNELELVEHQEQTGLSTQVLYFILPTEPFAGLVRKVTITNTSSFSTHLEICDGLPAVIPFGADNGALKHVSRTIEAWMQVENHHQNVPFYRLRASAADEAEVSSVTAGHFALGSSLNQGQIRQLPVIVDPDLVFGHQTSLHTPTEFIKRPLADVLDSSQVSSGKTPCAFFGLESTLEPEEKVVIHSVYGHIRGMDALHHALPLLSDPIQLAEKKQAARDLAQDLTAKIQTRTADPVFDAYTKQTFLDNMLRGGWSALLGTPPQNQVYHIYGRKHGDLERDYNDFFLPAEFFSSGNGNYRDVNQNRRCDVFFNPKVESHNILYFLSLMQMDGYNPLVVRGISFSLSPQAQKTLLTSLDKPRKLAPFLKGRFTPGGLLQTIRDHHIDLSTDARSFLNQVISSAEVHLEADFGEGYWIDHWTYLLDQIESFLAIFPERKRDLLLGEDDLPFYQSPAQVLPRRKRYVLTEHGPRQYHALDHTGESGWIRTPEGERYTTSVLGKLILIATLKFSTLDPEGMGIEMEAGKPGWYDALNGLPGLFGSSMAESYELLRLSIFLQDFLTELKTDAQVPLPVELVELMQELVKLTRKDPDPFLWWKKANRLRESYRDKVYHDFSGEDITWTVSNLVETFKVFEDRLRKGISRAEEWIEGDIPPTYFHYEMTSYQFRKNQAEEIIKDPQNRPYLEADAFQAVSLPIFLEGAVRSLKAVPTKEYPRKLHTAVKSSSLYDQSLHMFKLNAPLKDQSHEIGRARAFTPGWLENESIWLHMAYKYLLELLQAELFEEFWEEARNSLVCFQPRERYGRSILENSSFLVSSAHPDESLHGAGFAARLSGSTAEFTHMWTLIMAGKTPFYQEEGELHLKLRPALPAQLFDDQNQIRFNFLGSIPVTYHNPQRVDSWKLSPQRIDLQLPDHKNLIIKDSYIPPPYAAMIRSQKIESIEVFFSP
ncbi:MAG: hypothetical protein R6U51_03975 [Anaerolineales bacterium]